MISAKLIIFFVIILLIYFIFIRSSTKSTSVNNKKCLNESFKTNLTNRAKRTDIDLGMKSTPIHRNNPPNLIKVITSELVDSQYKFNLKALPVSTRYASTNSICSDEKYLRHIRNNIRSWDKILKRYGMGIKIIKLIPILISETEDEFIIVVGVKLSYVKNSKRVGTIYNIELIYYGKIMRSDDFLNGGSDIYILQLTSMRTINWDEDSYNRYNDHGPFISMKEQLDYVEEVNQMHKNEGKSE